jgi:hypothetical protein
VSGHSWFRCVLLEKGERRKLSRRNHHHFNLLMANKFQFSSFKSSFSTNVSALKRRFSSGDLENDGYEETAKDVIGETTATAATTTTTNTTTVKSSPSVQNDVGASASSSSGAASSVTTTSGPPPRGTSAPTSPSRSTSSGSIFQRLQSVTGAARDVTRDITSQVISTVQAGVGGGQANVKVPYKDPNTLIVLVIDDANTDW